MLSETVLPVKRPERRAREPEGEPADETRPRKRVISVTDFNLISQAICKLWGN